jgi:amidase
MTGELELAFAGPVRLARLVADGEVSPRELVELFLRRIERFDPRLNAFRAVLAEEALAAVQRPLRGPLAGVPVAIKDDTAVQGHPVTRGSRAPAVPAPADAEIVARLRAAGAIPIGITNVPELMIFPWTASDANGITHNPWDPSRTPGGSSGGSGAAVAAGIVPAATGSDGGGSIRIPAACCGLVGMKPTRGRVSSHPAAEDWLGLSTRGMLARTVPDAALLLDVVSGARPGDSDAWPAPERPFAESAAEPPPRRLRIAISRKVPPGLLARLSDDQALAYDRTARLLGELGHQVLERDPDYGVTALEFTQTYLAGISADFDTLPPDGPTERSTRQMAALGRRLVPPRRRMQLRERRPRVVARILRLWDEADVLLTPGLARTALPAQAGYGRSAPVAFNLASRFTPWTPLFNLTGQPAVSLPAGFGADGLPLSVQLVGRPGEEGLLLALAGEIEAAAPWAGRRPAIGGSA